jgi:2-haloacid dehalogenase
MTESTPPRTRWVTFDCFGTLVDWRTGFSEILRPVAGAKTPSLLQAYHRFEPQVQAERPFRRYHDVLIRSLLLAAQEVGLDLTTSDAEVLPQHWSALPVFPDVEEALAGLRALGCNIGVLTNCDDALFEQTQRSFRVAFDRVVTAEQVQAYKPSLRHFQFFERTSGVDRADWVHVACSWFHDIAPARRLGIQRIWLDRDHTGEDPSAASLRMVSAKGLPAAVRQLCRNPG